MKATRAQRTALAYVAITGWQAKGIHMSTWSFCSERNALNTERGSDLPMYIVPDEHAALYQGTALWKAHKALTDAGFRCVGKAGRRDWGLEYVDGEGCDATLWRDGSSCSLAIDNDPVFGDTALLRCEWHGRTKGLAETIATFRDWQPPWPDPTIEASLQTKNEMTRAHGAWKLMARLTLFVRDSGDGLKAFWWGAWCRVGFADTLAGLAFVRHAFKAAPKQADEHAKLKQQMRTLQEMHAHIPTEEET